MPLAIALADVIASIHLAIGITGALLRRERTGLGGRVETSLLESMLDLKFELLSAHLGDPSIVVKRGECNTAQAFLQAPYGVTRPPTATSRSLRPRCPTSACSPG